MARRFGILALVGALFLVTGEAWAQAPAGMEETVRPATTSIYGDTGLWFVPTGEVLRDKTWSASGYRVNWDVRQGFTDIPFWELCLRREGAGRTSALFDYHAHRPRYAQSSVLEATATARRQQSLCPRRVDGNSWRAFLGARSASYRSRQHPVAIAVRGMVRSTGSADKQSGTGKMDGSSPSLSARNPSTAKFRKHRLPSSGYPDDYDRERQSLRSARNSPRDPADVTTEWYGCDLHESSRNVSPPRHRYRRRRQRPCHANLPLNHAMSERPGRRRAGCSRRG